MKNKTCYLPLPNRSHSPSCGVIARCYFPPMLSGASPIGEAVVEWLAHGRDALDDLNPNPIGSC